MANNCSDFPSALAFLEEAHAVHQEDHDAEGEALVLVQAASVLHNQGRYAEARQHLEAARPMFAASGYKYRQAVVTGNLGTILVVLGELGAGRRLLVEGLALSEEVRDKEGVATGLGTLGDLYRRVGDLDQAQDHLRRSLAAAPDLDASYLVSDSLLGLALVAAERGDLTEALERSREAADEADRAGSQLALARARFGEGVIRAARGELEAAAVALDEARRRAEDLGLTDLPLEAKAALAWVALQDDRVDDALGLVEPLLGRLDAAGLEGCLDPGRVILCCWRVLCAAGDRRCGDVLDAAGAFLDEMASRIDEDDLRRGFLERVTSNVELMAARRGTPA